MRVTMSSPPSKVGCVSTGWLFLLGSTADAHTMPRFREGIALADTDEASDGAVDDDASEVAGIDESAGAPHP